MPIGVYDHRKTKTPIYTAERNGKIGIKNKVKLKGKHNSPKTQFKKGHIISNETRIKIGKASKLRGGGGWMKGKKWHQSEEAKRKIGLANKGKKISEETLRKISGSKNHGWRGGISKRRYPPEFNELLKVKIRLRDGYVCCLCGRTEREELEELNRVLCVNHIDYDKNNCKEENLNTLCLRCNVKINRERDYWQSYFTGKMKMK